MLKQILLAAAALAVGLPLWAQTPACTFTISPSSANIAAAGGNATFTVMASASTCDRTAVSNVEWITITAGDTGRGNGSVSYSVAPNTFSTARTGTITVMERTFTVTQAGASCSFGLSPNSATYTANGGSGSFNLNTSCSWIANPSADWVRVISAASGTGSAVIEYTVSANLTPLQRTATIQLGTLNFTITQTAACATTLMPASISLPQTAFTGTVSVVSTVSTCDRAAVSQVPWITVTGGATGTGNGTVTYTVQANNTPQERQGAIGIGLAIFNVTQAPSTTCSYNVSPASASISAAGASGTFSITTACVWTVASSADWLSVTSAVSGAGNSTLTYKAAANLTTERRSASISVAGATNFTVNQAGVPCSVSLSGNGITVLPGGDGGAFDVSAPPGCPWQASVPVPWITLGTAQGLGSGTVTFTVAANPTPQPRSSSVIVNDVSYSIQQPGSTCNQAISPVSSTIGAAGGSGALAVSTACTYTAQSATPWITLTNGAAGGPGEALPIEYTARPNDSANPRTGTILVSGQIFTLTQAGKTCDVTLPSENGTLEGNGGSGRFLVASGPNCAWTPVSNDSWLRVVSWSNAGGNGAVTFGADRNPSAGTRGGSVSVGNKLFTVVQDGAKVTIAAGGIINGASFAATGNPPLAPGLIVAIFGSDMGPAKGVSAVVEPGGNRLPFEVGETRVWFDEFPAPVLFSSAGQVSAIVPFEIAGRTTAEVRVEYTGVSSPAVAVRIAPTSPAIFTANGRGTGQGIVFNQDFRANAANNQAVRGQVVIVYATGLGVMNPPQATGAVTGTVLQPTAAPVTATIGNIDAPVLYAGSAPGLAAGVVQLNIRVPANAPVNAAVPILIRAGGVASQAGVTLATR